MTTTGGPATFEIALFADLQYADKDDRLIEGRLRFYRAALSRLQRSVLEINQIDLAAVLHLGDIVDGNSSDATTMEDFLAVVELFRSIRHPMLHVIGNHCLDVGRQHLVRELQIDAYYSRQLAVGWKIAVVDTTDVGVRGSSVENIAVGQAWLEANAMRANAQDWNGGVGKTQLLWLRNLFVNSRREGVRVIVAGHMPLQAAAASAKHLAFNHDEITALLDEFSDVCPLYICGHCHHGGYTRTEAGVHHVTVEGVVEFCSDVERSYATLRVMPGSIEIDGAGGGVTSRVLNL